MNQGACIGPFFSFGTSFFGAVSAGDPVEVQDDLPADGIADEVEIE